MFSNDIKTDKSDCLIDKSNISSFLPVFHINDWYFYEKEQSRDYWLAKYIRHNRLLTPDNVILIFKEIMKLFVSFFKKFKLNFNEKITYLGETGCNTICPLIILFENEQPRIRIADIINVYELTENGNTFNTYSLSILLFHLTVGRNPFSDVTFAKEKINKAYVNNERLNLPPKYENMEIDDCYDPLYIYLRELFHFLNDNNNGKGFDIDSFLEHPLIKRFN